MTETAETVPDGGAAEFLKGLGQRLRSAREKAGLSAAEASARAQVNAAVILRYERGESGPGAQKILALADSYGVCCNWLLGRLDWNVQADEGTAVADLDKIEAVENAKTEEDISELILWKPPPVLAVVSIPARRKIVSGSEAMGIGAALLETIRSIAPNTHRRWASQHIRGNSHGSVLRKLH